VCVCVWVETRAAPLGRNIINNIKQPNSGYLRTACTSSSSSSSFAACTTTRPWVSDKTYSTCTSQCVPRRIGLDGLIRRLRIRRPRFVLPNTMHGNARGNDCPGSPVTYTGVCARGVTAPANERRTNSEGNRDFVKRKTSLRLRGNGRVIVRARIRLEFLIVLPLDGRHGVKRLAPNTRPRRK